jgi:MFS family permease
MGAALEESGAQRVPARPGFAERLGLPSPRGRWRVIGAVLTDTFGVGLLFPISLLYFTLVTHYSVARIGLLLTVATFASLPAGLLGGQLVDRYGPGKVLVANNLCSAVGYVGYYLANRTVVIFAGMFLVAVADRMFWSSWLPYLRQVATHDRFDTWFAFLEALKAACLGLGAGVAGLLLAMGGHAALRVLVLINIATCLVSAVLISLQRLPTRRQAEDGAPPAPGWRPVLRDARILAISAGQMLFTPISLVGTTALPVFYVREWHMGTWTGSALFMFASAVFFLTQSYVVKAVRNIEPVLVLIIACGLYCAAMALLFVFSLFYRPAPGTGLVLALATMTLVVSGIMLYFPTSSSVLMSMVTDQTSGRATGVFHTGTSIAMAATPLLMGGLLGTPSYLWAVLAIATAGGTACFAWAARRPAESAAAMPEGVAVPAGE